MENVEDTLGDKNTVTNIINCRSSFFYLLTIISRLTRGTGVPNTKEWQPFYHFVFFLSFCLIIWCLCFLIRKHCLLEGKLWVVLETLHFKSPLVPAPSDSCSAPLLHLLPWQLYVATRPGSQLHLALQIHFLWLLLVFLSGSPCFKFSWTGCFWKDILWIHSAKIYLLRAALKQSTSMTLIRQDEAVANLVCNTLAHLRKFICKIRHYLWMFIPVHVTCTLFLADTHLRWLLGCPKIHTI